jgi:TetR/AcrR family transcriptional regulator, cholesterol catabolism regulator
MEVRERILKAAEELFMKFGIRRVTMDEIASELGISKKTIYLHFEDKDAIVHEVATLRMSCDQAESDLIYREAQNPIDEVFREIEMFKSHAAALNPVVVYDLKKYYPKTWQLFQKHKQTIFLEVTKRNLQEGVEQGLYRKEINIDILSRLRMEEIDFAFDQSVFPHEKFNQFEVHKAFIDHFLRGIITEKGLEIYHKYITTSQI